MSIHALRAEVQERLDTFLWEQWAQMGALSVPSRRDKWAADPEALLLLSFEVGREDPRLFDEVLDWMLVNVRLLSTQRLRNLAVDEADRALAGATIAWLREWRQKRPRPSVGEPESSATAEPLFLGTRVPIRKPDAAFLEHGLLKAQQIPERRSARPDLAAPLNLALRMRSLLGVGARAEVIRVLITSGRPQMSVQDLAASTGYAKRNVQEAAASLRAAGVARSSTVGNEQRFDVPIGRWLQLLELPKAPSYVAWPQVFCALRTLLRWLRRNDGRELSEYMLASEARSALEKVAERLRIAGVEVDAKGRDGADYWTHFASEVRKLIAI